MCMELHGVAGGFREGPRTSQSYRVSIGFSIGEGLRERLKASPEESPGESLLVRKSFAWLESIRKKAGYVNSPKEHLQRSSFERVLLTRK